MTNYTTYWVQFSLNSGCCVPLPCYVWKYRLGSVFVKSVTQVWAVKLHLLPDGDAWSPPTVALQNCVISQDKDQQDSPNISNNLLNTWNSVEPPVIWKENTWWTIFLISDCLLGYSGWFWFSSFQHSNEFFSLCQAGIKFSLGQLVWKLPSALQIRAAQSHKSDHLCCY